jgi:hypothetical protein
LQNINLDYFITSQKTTLEDISAAIYKPPTIHNDDKVIFNFLILLEYKAIIAGGCALAWYQNQPVGKRDIDIWFPNEQKFVQLSDRLLSHSFCRKIYDTKDAETWEIRNSLTGPNYRVQLIKNRFYTSPQDVIGNFDITVCQIATDGNTWWHSDQFCQDLKDRRLRLTKTHPSSVKRLIKYWTYGFQPSDLELQMIVDNPDTMWDFTNETDEGYANAV